jgi:hypothetical protein
MQRMRKIQEDAIEAVKKATSSLKEAETKKELV